MTNPEQEKINTLTMVILANANVARKARLVANRRISEVIEESHLDEKELCTLMQFIEMFMDGTDREEIFRKLQVSPEMQEKLTNMRSLNW